MINVNWQNLWLVMNKMINKKAQEEMVGFVLIIILVSVILLVFLGFSLRSPQKEAVESYEVDSFIQGFLQYTTDCADSYEPNYFSVQDLIFECNSEEVCLNGRESCDVLSSTLSGIVEESWKTGEERPVKGYELRIVSNEIKNILLIEEGNLTGNSKGGFQDFFKGGDSIEIFFNAYY